MTTNELPAMTPAQSAAAHVLIGAYLLLREDATVKAQAATLDFEAFSEWCTTSPVYAAKFAAAVREVGRIAAGGAE